MTGRTLLSLTENLIFDAMRKILVTLMVVAFAACNKTVTDPSVSIIEEKTFSDESGRFMVLINGNGVWSVSTSDEWIHVEQRYYKDEAAFEICFDSNESSIGDHRFCRVGKVYVSSWDGARRDEVILRQEGLVPIMTISDVAIESTAGTYAMPIYTNLSDRERNSLNFSSDASWITELSYGRDGESILFNASAGNGRSATVSLTFTDAWGREFTSSAKVTQ